MTSAVPDGFAVLASIAAHPDAFGSVAARARDMAQRLVVEQIGAKGASPASVKAVFDAIGAEAFARALDAMKDAESRKLAVMLGEPSPDPDADARQARRGRILGLLRGDAKPRATPAKAAKSRAPTAPRRASGHRATSAQTRFGDRE